MLGRKCNLIYVCTIIAMSQATGVIAWRLRPSLAWFLVALIGVVLALVIGSLTFRRAPVELTPEAFRTQMRALVAVVGERSYLMLSAACSFGRR
jgi:CHASE2 domain-containing sensor protein